MGLQTETFNKTATKSFDNYLNTKADPLLTITSEQKDRKKSSPTAKFNEVSASLQSNIQCMPSQTETKETLSYVTKEDMVR